jgi:hypothetical protein
MEQREDHLPGAGAKVLKTGWFFALFTFVG